MSCNQIEELLSDLIDGELAEGARAGVEAHLAACERCRAAYRALLRTVRFVRANAEARLAASSPGGAYMDFTRAISDPDDRRPPEDVIASVFRASEDANGRSAR